MIFLNNKSIHSLRFNEIRWKIVAKGDVTRGNFFLQLGTQIWVKKILQAPVEF